MNSLERKELRYQRSKKKREDKLITNSNKYADVNKCFTFNKVYGYAKKCTRNVGYKKSINVIIKTDKNVKVKS